MRNYHKKIIPLAANSPHAMSRLPYGKPTNISTHQHLSALLPFTQNPILNIPKLPAKQPVITKILQRIYPHNSPPNAQPTRQSYSP
ncbi:hypothetical protein B9Z19DRAFT_769694 [Tuber borchii]|uniref:Uncharacterized protein n=1 Tax=Tuber borchii TaxID=42251 RepID=A0A2T6Z9N0_TUBBO|nr:hypothetical protein B9Z19DRAFT_769694 [Tuber borchii]